MNSYQGLTIIKAVKNPQKVFICIPGAGATVLSFMHLAESIHEQHHCQVIGFQARGFQSGEIPFSSVEEASQHFFNELRTYFKDSINTLDFYMIGHSFGGWIAFDMAQLFLSQTMRLKCLWIVDAKPPATSLDQVKMIDDQANFEKIVRLFEIQTQSSLSEIREQINHVPKADLERNLFNQLVNKKFFHKNMPFDIFHSIIQMVMVNAATHFLPKQPFEGDAVLLIAKESCDEKLLGLDNIEFRWRVWLPTLKTKVVLANHINILQDTSVRALINASMHRSCSSRTNVHVV